MKMSDPESQKFKTGIIPGSMPSMHVVAMFRPTSGFITFSLALGSLERYPAIPVGNVKIKTLKWKTQ